MEPYVRIELTYPIYRTGASPAMLTGRKMEPTPGIEPESAAYRAAALPLSYIGWSTASESNRILRYTRPVHRRQCLQCWSGWPVTIRRLQFGRLRPCHWTTPA